MARSKTLQGEQSADLATFMNRRSSFYGTATFPAGARVLIESDGHKIISQKLIDESGNPLLWNIQPVQQSPAGAA